MTTLDARPQGHQELPVQANCEPAPQAPQARPYEGPELHAIGSLAKLQHYGFNYNDGYRYKDSY